jgi:hypothetical protein
MSAGGKTSGQRSESFPNAYDFQVVEPSAQKCVQDVIKSVLGTATFSAAQAKSQVNSINRKIVSNLNQLTGNFKWIVTTLICQMGETGTNGLQMDHSAMWDPHTDGCFVIEWKSRSVQATVCVCGLAL